MFRNNRLQWNILRIEYYKRSNARTTVRSILYFYLTSGNNNKKKKKKEAAKNIHIPHKFWSVSVQQLSLLPTGNLYLLINASSNFNRLSQLRHLFEALLMFLEFASRSMFSDTTSNNEQANEANDPLILMNKSLTLF